MTAYTMTAKDNREFSEAMISSSPLDIAIDWMNRNIGPQDVFDEQKLIAWAENNGYIKE
jgi:hypothetical protein